MAKFDLLAHGKGVWLGGTARTPRRQQKNQYRHDDENRAKRPHFKAILPAYVAGVNRGVGFVDGKNPENYFFWSCNRRSNLTFCSGVRSTSMRCLASLRTVR